MSFGTFVLRILLEQSKICLQLHRIMLQRPACQHVLRSPGRQISLEVLKYLGIQTEQIWEGLRGKPQCT
jgi:hypothetical protein